MLRRSPRWLWCGENNGEQIEKTKGLDKRARLSRVFVKKNGFIRDRAKKPIDNDAVHRASNESAISKGGGG